jgi:hypothetical protein
MKAMRVAKWLVVVVWCGVVKLCFVFCELGGVRLNHRNDNADNDEDHNDRNKSPRSGMISTVLFDFVEELVHGDADE